MTKHFWKYFGVFSLITIISAVTFRVPFVHEPLFWLITAATFGLTVHRVEWGLYIILAELLIGSKGHLFWFTLIDDVEWGRIGLRIGIFGAVMVAWAIHKIWKRQMPTLFMDSSLTYVLPFLIMLGYAVVRGFMQGYGVSQIMSDANNWMFVVLVFPIVDVIKTVPDFFDQCRRIIAPAIAFMVTKAVVFFVVFAAGISQVTVWLYHFERQTGGGQLAPAADGMWRIYFWSELFLIPALVILAGIVYSRYDKRCVMRLPTFALWGVVLGIMLTLFRSFWLGAFVAVVVWIGAMVLARKHIELQWKSLAAVVGVLVLSAAASVFVIQGLGQGLSNMSGGVPPAVQKELFSTGEPGIQNRLNQFTPLVEKIWESPVVGSGFGAHITYESIDPRTTGAVTTHALELGWLDLMMEIGILGLILFLIWLGYIVRTLWQALSNSPKQVYWILGLIAGGVGIGAVHMVSPFLNHPLGIGFILFAYAYALRYSHHFSRTH